MGARRLTRETVEAIRAKYALGGVSYATLAAEYGTSKRTIYRVVKFDDQREERADAAQKAAEVAAEKTMVEFLCTRRANVQTLIDRLMAASANDIDSASLRDKMGAIKILSELMIGADREIRVDATGSGVSVNISFADTSVPMGDADDDDGT